MDTSPEYAAMCKAAKELRLSPMRYEKGSVYAVSGVNVTYMLDKSLKREPWCVTLYYGLSGFRYANHYHFQAYPGKYWQTDHGRTTTYYTKKPCEFPENIVWLPRQDQLQEMMPNTHLCVGFQFMDMWKELDRYTEMEQREHRMYYQQANSWEQLWLLYVMYVCHKKIWNGKEWEKA